MDRGDPSGAPRIQTVIATPSGVVHLDASFLIRGLALGSPEALRLDRWNEQGRVLAMSTLAWGQFLCGPLGTGDDALAERIVSTHVPIGLDEAREAARLFNETGRRRSSFPDCLIAAAAILASAPLATTDHGDFERFREFGLDLAG